LVIILSAEAVSLFVYRCWIMELQSSLLRVFAVPKVRPNFGNVPNVEN
jgi:hypothetical protein